MYLFCFFYCCQKCTLYFFLFFPILFQIALSFCIFRSSDISSKKQHRKSTNLCCISFVLMIWQLLFMVVFFVIWVCLVCSFCIFNVFRANSLLQTPGYSTHDITVVKLEKLRARGSSFDIAPQFMQI